MFHNNPLLSRELRERWRRPITFLLLGFYCVVVAWLTYASFSVFALRTELSPAQNAAQGEDFFLQFSVLQLILGLATGLLFAAPTLAQERERQSLRDYVLAGLSPLQIVLAKFGAVVSLLLVLEIIGFPMLSLCYLFGGVAPLQLGASNALVLALAGAGAALGLNISAGARSVGRAMGGAFIALFVTSLFALPLFIALLSAPLAIVLLVTALAAGVPLLLLPFSVVELGFSALSEAPQREDELQIAAPINKAKSGSPPRVEAEKTKAPPVVQAPRPHFEGVFELSFLENWLNKAANRNAITQRHWRVRLREAKIRDLSESYFWVSGLLTIFATVSVLLVAFYWFFIDQWSLSPSLGRNFTCLFGFIAMFKTASLAASAFTGERAQKMLTTLQLTSLSPLEIVSGKIVFALLWTLRAWFWPLSAALLASAFFDVSTLWLFVALGAALLLAASLGVGFSLLCQGAGIAATGAVTLLFGSFVILPFFLTDYFFNAMPLLVRLWLAPLQRVLWDSPHSLSMEIACWQVALNCVFMTFFVGFLTTLYLARLRGEEENAGFLQRDLNRSWQ